MNILRHKSWHVRNRNNITRVRKDEEKARNEELEKEKRISLADSERRVDLLRQRLSSTGQSNATTTVVEGSSGSHLNIFEDFSDKITTKNKEHEKEVKEEKEKFEKKTGILQYLVDKETDSGNNWYLDSHEKRMNLKNNKSNDIDLEQDFKDNKLKKLNDPLEVMNRYLDSMKPKSNSKSHLKHKTNDKSVKILEKSGHKSELNLDKMSTKSKKSKKHKKQKKKKRKRNSSESSNDSNEKTVTKLSKTMEQLRAERLEREKIERERTRTLLYGKSQSETVIIDDRLRKFNSQFNPDIARQNIDK